MSSPKISIIVPVYKVEAYLTRCIESILIQTFTDFELILIDDGSPDTCGKICDEYAQKDIRIKVIHKENEGVSNARNTGLYAANGEYIAFVDSDDYVDVDYLMAMYNAITENQSDLVICGVRYRDCSNLDNFSEQADINNFSVDKKDYSQVLYRLLEQRRINYVYSKLYKRSVLRENRVLFDTKITLGEDTIFVCDVLKFAKRISVIGNCYYNYVKYYSGTLTTQFYKDIYDKYLYVTNYVKQTMISIECLNNEMNNVIDDRKIISAVWSISSIRNQKQISIFYKIKLIKKVMNNKEFIQSFRRRMDFYKQTDIKLMSCRNPILLLLYYYIEPKKLRIKGLIRKIAPDCFVRWYKQWTLK